MNHVWLLTGLLAVSSSAPANEGASLNGAHSLEPTTEGSASPPVSFFWGDYDGDERVDVMTVVPGEGAHLLRNLGQGHFEDVSASTGLLGQADEAFQAVWADYDQDGRLDVFLSSYLGESHLLRQTEAGRFEDVGLAAGLPLLTRVVDASWVRLEDQRGPDLLLTSLDGKRFFRNLGVGFSEGDLALRQPARTSTGPEPATVTEARRALGLGSLETPGLSLETGLNATASAGSTCIVTIRDSATGNCIKASSIPKLGQLLPLGPQFFVAPLGNVGIGTTTPVRKLDVNGTVRMQGFVLNTDAATGRVLTSDSAGVGS